MRHLSRRGAVTTLTALAALCAVNGTAAHAATTPTSGHAAAPAAAPAPALAAASTMGGPITASEVMARARDWYTRSPALVYNRTRAASTLVPDIDGAHKYGPDCSGMVSMALHINPGSIGGRNTDTLDDPDFATEIPYQSMRPGDFLDDTIDGHAVLFESWAPDHVHFSYWSFGGNPMMHYNGGHGDNEGPLGAIASGTNLGTHPSTNYKAYHYPNLISNVGHDSTGYYNPGDGTFHLNDAINGQSGTSYAWDTGYETVPNVQVLVGDWNGDGKDSVGYYNPTDGTFHLTDALNGQPSTSYAWDTGFETVPNVKVLVGDWDGDGKDSVGYYNPSDGTFHLGDAINGQPGTSYAWDTGFETVPNVQILVGDWNGDGKDSVGYYNPSDGTFHLGDAINGQPGTSYAWDTGFENVANVKIVVGDWNGDGKDSVGYYNPGDGTFHLNDAINGQPGTSYAWDTGFENVANVKILIGDWDGN